MLRKDVMRQLKLTLCLVDKNQENEGKIGRLQSVKQQEPDDGEGNACGMNEIRILLQGELVVLYQRSV